jgi:F0F1-type ATP synthase assembly protein I
MPLSALTPPANLLLIQHSLVILSLIAVMVKEIEASVSRVFCLDRRNEIA